MGTIVYSTPTCPWCKKLKTWLRRRRIKFDDRDVTEESKYRDELIEKSGQMSVPVTEINGKIIVGFDEKVLLEEVKKLKAKSQ